jgi:predicted nucleotidyltransferase
MNRAEMIDKLKAAEPQLRAHGIAGLYLFGSYARDEAQPDSDVDVFIDKTPGRRFGFDELMGGYFALEDAIPGIKISFGTREELIDPSRTMSKQAVAAGWPRITHPAGPYQDGNQSISACATSR